MDLQMRRVFSILFILLFGLGPLAATIDGDDASLPACCRRHGAHHCALSSTASSRTNQLASRAPALTAPSHCPLFPIGNPSPSPSAPLALSAFDSLHAKERTQCQQAFNADFGGIHLQTPTLRGPPTSS